MSKVKLVVIGRNTLGYGEITDVVLDLKKSDQVIGVVETDFEPEEDGSVRTSDGLDPVITVDAINHLVGKMLTLTEAMFSDAEQRKAAKDMYMQQIWDWYTGHNETLQRTWRFNKGYETDKPV